MCGIAGCFGGAGGAPQRAAAVAVMARALGHRGPDAEGLWESADRRAVLAHRRLAVLDLDPRSNQPMLSPDGMHALSYNGELYNYRELRAALEKEGWLFRTGSDTEVVLAALAIWETAALARMDGMFAFAYYNAKKQSLLLARDRCGEKPLHYARDGKGCLWFCSELKPLAGVLAARPKLSAKGLCAYFLLRYVPAPDTIYEGVSQVEPGTWIELDREGRLVRRRWYSFARDPHPEQVDADEYVTATADALTQSIASRVVADVPVGIFLSSGIDSSLVATLAAQRLGLRFTAFCASFAGADHDEAPHAARLASHLGLPFERIAIDEQELLATLPEFGHHLDEPNGDRSCVPTYVLARRMRERVTVALSGDGGDELFAGYVTYVADKLQRGARFLPAPAARLLRAGAERFLKPSFGKVGFDYKLRQFLAGSALPPERAHFSWRTLFSDDERTRLFRPEHRDAAAADAFAGFAPHFAEAKGLHWLDQALYVDTKTWLVDDILVKADRMSMAHALEVRAPLLDHRLLEFAAGLPVAWKLNGFKKKWLLRRLMAQRFPRVLSRPKAGFNAPVSHWLLDELHDIARAATATAAMREWFRAEEIERLWVEHRDRRRDNGYRLFALTCLGLWLDRHGRAPC